MKQNNVKFTNTVHMLENWFVSLLTFRFTHFFSFSFPSKIKIICMRIWRLFWFFICWCWKWKSEY